MPTVDERASGKVTCIWNVDVKGQNHEEFAGQPQINQAQFHDSLTRMAKVANYCVLCPARKYRSPPYFPSIDCHKIRLIYLRRGMRSRFELSFLVSANKKLGLSARFVLHHCMSNIHHCNKMYFLSVKVVYLPRYAPPFLLSLGTRVGYAYRAQFNFPSEWNYAL